MVSYVEAARELDERWSFSLSFLSSIPLPQPPGERPDFAATEADLFRRYATEIAQEHGLHIDMLVQAHEILLMNNLIGNDATETDQRFALSLQFAG